MSTQMTFSGKSLARHGGDFGPRMIEVRREKVKPAKCESPAETRLAITKKKERVFEQKVLSLMPIVSKVAARIRKHLPAHVELNDLVGEGILGLLDAVRKFDAHKHVRIENYAQYRIRGAILDGLRDLDNASRDMRRKTKKVETLHRGLEMKLGSPVGNEELAEAMGMSLKGLHRTLGELQGAGLEWLRPMSCATGKQLTEESLPATGQENQLDRCYRREQKDILRRALARIPERERAVVLLYDFAAMTMKQIAAKLRVDESRVSQLHSAAVARLRSKVKALLRPRVTPQSYADVLSAVQQREARLPDFQTIPWSQQLSN